MSDQFTTERDSYGRLLADREVWRQAGTLAAAGELTARWLEGTSEYQPGTLAPRFDDETLPIAGQLAELNRTGLFTKESQPGLGPDAGHAQREYVTGFCSAESAALLLRLSAETELIAIAHAPGEVSRPPFPSPCTAAKWSPFWEAVKIRWSRSGSSDWARESNETMPSCWPTHGTSNSLTRSGARSSTFCPPSWKP